MAGCKIKTDEGGRKEEKKGGGERRRRRGGRAKGRTGSLLPCWAFNELKPFPLLCLTAVVPTKPDIAWPIVLPSNDPAAHFLAQCWGMPQKPSQKKIPWLDLWHRREKANSSSSSRHADHSRFWTWSVVLSPRFPFWGRF